MVRCCIMIKIGVISLLLFLLSTNAFANTNQQIEVFDCQKKWSFKTIFRSNSPKEAVQYAKAITGPFKT